MDNHEILESYREALRLIEQSKMDDMQVVINSLEKEIERITQAIINDFKQDI